MHLFVRAENTRPSLVNYDPMLKMNGANTSDQHSQCKPINIHNTNGIGLRRKLYLLDQIHRSQCTQLCALSPFMYVYQLYTSC